MRTSKRPREVLLELSKYMRTKEMLRLQTNTKRVYKHMVSGHCHPPTTIKYLEHNQKVRRNRKPLKSRNRGRSILMDGEE